MKAIFLILFVFATFMVFLGVSERSASSGTLGNALLFGGGAIYFGILVSWISYRISRKS